jgi:hypothetical protein
MQGVFAKLLGVCSSKKQIPTHSIKFILTSKCGAIHIGLSRTERQHMKRNCQYLNMSSTVCQEILAQHVRLLKS